MMHKAWSNIEEVPFFQGHLLKFQGNTGQKLPILTRIERFRTVTQFEFTCGLKWCTKLDVV